MDGDACLHACMYGPVSRVPQSVSLGDHTMGGGRDPESGLIYIYIYLYNGHMFYYRIILNQLDVS